MKIVGLILPLFMMTTIAYAGCSEDEVKKAVEQTSAKSNYLKSIQMVKLYRSTADDLERQANDLLASVQLHPEDVEPAA